MRTPKHHVTVARLLIAALCVVMLAASPPVLYAAHNQNHDAGGSGKGNQDQDKEDKDEDQDKGKKGEDQDKDKKGKDKDQDKQDKGNQGPPGGGLGSDEKSSEEKGGSDEQPTESPPAPPEIRVLEPRADDETRGEESEKDSVIKEGAIHALVVGPASVTVQVSPAGDARRTYVRLGRRIIDMVELSTSLGARYTTVLPALREPRGLPFTVTADFGSTTASVKGLLLPQPAGASTTRVPEPEFLLPAVNAVFRFAHDRNPTGADWSYWANRILRGEKTSVPDLFGAMQWQQRFGRR